jgi:26S proteasome regulatory subunit N1
MAKEGERPTAADKGKGKVDDARELKGQKRDVKDEKNATQGKKDGKKDEEPQEGKQPLDQAFAGDLFPRYNSNVDTNRLFNVEELSEEDQQLRNELEMLVERLKVCCYAAHVRFCADCRVSSVGTRYFALSTRARCHQDIH